MTILKKWTFIEEAKLPPKAPRGKIGGSRRAILNDVAANPGKWCYCAHYDKNASAHAAASGFRKLAADLGINVEVTIRRKSDNEVGIYILGL